MVHRQSKQCGGDWNEFFEEKSNGHPVQTAHLGARKIKALDQLSVES
jgi:hypothetical protein